MKYNKTFKNMCLTGKHIEIEIENEFPNNPKQGLNIAGISPLLNDELILNIVLKYEDVLELYNHLTQYIQECENN